MLRKLFSCFVIFGFLAFNSVITAPQTYAQTICTISIGMSTFPPSFNNTVTVNSQSDCFITSQTYTANWHKEGAPANQNHVSVSKVNSATQLEFPLNLSNTVYQDTGNWVVNICAGESSCGTNVDQKIATGTIAVTDNAQDPSAPSAEDLPIVTKTGEAICKVQAGKTITFTATNLIEDREYEWFLPSDNAGDYFATPIENGRGFPKDIGTFEYRTSGSARPEKVCIDFNSDSETFRIEGANCINFNIVAGQIPAGEDTRCDAINNSSLNATPRPPHPPCKDVPNGDGDLEKCTEVMTGLGISLKTDPQDFIVSIFTLFLSLSGGILLLIIIYSGYQFMLSRGDPEKVKVARERITSAIVGFIFLVFSIVILEVIGVDILRIPGFCRDNDASCKSANLVSPTPVPEVVASPTPARESKTPQRGN